MTPLALTLSPLTPLATPPSADAALVEAARRGRADAFDALLSRHQITARAIAGRIVRRDRAGLEDVLAEAACRAWVHLPRLRESARFKSWYCTIVRNAALDYSMKAGRERAPQTAQPDRPDAPLWWDRLVADTPDPQTEAERRDTMSLLREALCELEELYQVPVRRRCLDEASYQEIASELGKPVGTVKCLVHRGKSLLEQRLRDRHVLA